MNSLITQYEFHDALTNTSNYGHHRQFQPQARPSIRFESANDRLVAQRTSAAEDRDSNEPSQSGSRLLGLCDADHHQPASGRAERSLWRQFRCDSWRNRRFLGGYGFPCRRLSPSEVLRQTSGRAACQVPVRPYYVLEARLGNALRFAVLIGVSARGEKNE